MSSFPMRPERHSPTKITEKSFPAIAAAVPYDARKAIIRRGRLFTPKMFPYPYEAFHDALTKLPDLDGYVVGTVFYAYDFVSESLPYAERIVCVRKAVMPVRNFHGGVAPIFTFNGREAFSEYAYSREFLNTYSCFIMFNPLGLYKHGDVRYKDNICWECVL